MECIFLTGGSGLIGSQIQTFFRSKGFHIIRCKYGLSSTETSWDYQKKKINIIDQTPIDYVIHLGGQNVASSRWTAKTKQAILQSRVQSTKFLCEYFAKQKHKPKAFICASAIGIYGERKDEKLNEASAAGEGFLADVVKQWEQSSQSLEHSNIRTINLRFGTVLSRNGGALAKMLPAFRLGFGGKLGDGKQCISWISIEEISKIILFIIENEALNGAINCVSPNPATNIDLTKALSRVLKRPAFLPLPQLLITCIFGQMGKEILLQSTKAIPQKLLNAGYQFKHSNLEATLTRLIKKRI